MNLRSLIVALLIVPWFLALASAQPAPRVVSAEDKKKAAEHFERGRNAYNFGNYDIAIAEYQAAFDLTNAPEFVFNIAQTHRTKGNKTLALEFYKKYIELDPTGDGVVSARQHMEGIEKELKAEEAVAEAKRKAEADAAAKRAAEAEAARLAAAETARLEAAKAAQARVAVSESARHKTTSKYLRIAGIASMGTGVATIGVSALFGLRARSLTRETSAVTGMWTDEAEEKVDRANSSERTMFILLGVGGAVAITGGILYYVGSRKTESAPVDPKRITVTPSPIPSGGAVVIGGRF